MADPWVTKLEKEYDDFKTVLAKKIKAAGTDAEKKIVKMEMAIAEKVFNDFKAAFVDEEFHFAHQLDFRANHMHRLSPLENATADLVLTWMPLDPNRKAKRTKLKFWEKREDMIVGLHMENHIRNTGKKNETRRVDPMGVEGMMSDTVSVVGSLGAAGVSAYGGNFLTAITSSIDAFKTVAYGLAAALSGGEAEAFGGGQDYTTNVFKNNIGEIFVVFNQLKIYGESHRSHGRIKADEEMYFHCCRKIYVCRFNKNNAMNVAKQIKAHLENIEDEIRLVRLKKVFNLNHATNFNNLPDLTKLSKETPQRNDGEKKDGEANQEGEGEKVGENDADKGKEKENEDGQTSSSSSSSSSSSK